MTAKTPSNPQPPINRTKIIYEGVKAALSPAGLVLTVTFFAFGALVQALNLPLGFGLSLTAFVFAIPGQVVMLDEIANNTGPAAMFLAVMLTSIRLFPLTLSLMPLLKQPEGQRSRSAKFIHHLIAHFVAVTLWLQVNKTLPNLPARHRPYHGIGLCLGLLILTLTATLAGFSAGQSLPPSVIAGALIATPIYFFISLIETSTSRTDQAALVLGTILAIPLSLFWPEMTLLGAGLVGGTLAYLSTTPTEKADVAAEKPERKEHREP